MHEAHVMDGCAEFGRERSMSVIATATRQAALSDKDADSNTSLLGSDSPGLDALRVQSRHTWTAPCTAHARCGAH